jgi:hypothetical protein
VRKKRATVNSSGLDNSRSSDNEEEIKNNEAGRRTVVGERSLSRRASRQRGLRMTLTSSTEITHTENIAVGIRVRPLTEAEKKDPRNSKPK